MMFNAKITGFLFVNQHEINNINNLFAAQLINVSGCFHVNQHNSLQIDSLAVRST